MTMFQTVASLVVIIDIIKQNLPFLFNKKCKTARISFKLYAIFGGSWTATSLGVTARLLLKLYSVASPVSCVFVWID